MQPAALEASLAAVAEVERERAELARHWQLRRERARLRGRAGCPAIPGRGTGEPAGGPRTGAAVGEVVEGPASTGGGVRSLAADGPRPSLDRRRWRRSDRWPPTCRRCGRRPRPRLPSRQRIARLLLERVIATVDKASERVEVELHWVGGLVQSPHPGAAGAAVRSPVRLPAAGGAAEAAVCRAAQLGGDRRATQRGGIPAAEADRPVHGFRWSNG